MRKHRLHDIVLGMVIMALVMGLAMPALASNMVKTLNANYMDIKLVIDGVEVVPKDAGGNIVEPFVVDGTTYLPVRAVGEALGKKVTWDGDTKTVYLGEVPEKEEKLGVVGSFVTSLPYQNLKNAKDLPHIAAAIAETNADVSVNYMANSLALRPDDVYTTAYFYLEYHDVDGVGELWITRLGNYFYEAEDGASDYLKLVRAILEDVISDPQDVESIMGQVQRIHDAHKVIFNSEAEREWGLKECAEVCTAYKLNTVEVEWGNYPEYMDVINAVDLLRIRNKK